jgi:tetratricopeptide (TPR) repeat protein
VQPHAHQRAREVTGTAVLPDGSRKLLIHIGDWEFRWQHVYRYERPFSLPKGTRLEMEFVFDNSADNRKNPDFPPRRVYWGQRSADEMGDLWLQVLTRNEHDLQVLNDQFRPKVLAEDIVGYERWVSTEPDSAPLHDDLAMLYLEANRPADAVRHFAASAALRPDAASAHFNLATALTVAGNRDAAIAEYQRALAINPAYAQAHNNLGSILMSGGDLDAAMKQFDEALRLDRDNPQAHYNAATALRRQGRNVDAAHHYREALRLMPDSPQVLADFARLLATAREASLRDPGQALRLAERAVALTTRRDAGALDALAAAYDSLGDHDRAAEAADAALRLAPSDPALRDRLERYRTKP